MVGEQEIPVTNVELKTPEPETNTRHEENQLLHATNIQKEHTVDDEGQSHEGQHNSKVVIEKPKKPTSAYFFFLKEFRKEVTGLKNTEVMKQGGAAWKKLSEEEKVPFIKSAQKEKEIYDGKMKEYNNQFPKKETGPVKPKKPISSYFLFLSDFRQNKAEGVGHKDVMKLAGVAWKALSAEEKKPYTEAAAKAKEKHAKKMEQYEKEMAEFKRNHKDVNVDNPKEDKSILELQLPVLRVKKVMKLETSVKTVSKEATLLITKATELLLKHAAKKVGASTKATGRKSIQASHFNHIIMTHPSYRFAREAFEEAAAANHTNPFESSKKRKGQSTPAEENTRSKSIKSSSGVAVRKGTKKSATLENFFFNQG